MILVDANLLLYATNKAAPEHGTAARWLEARLNGDERVGLPWESLISFYRISTSPRILPRPLAGQDAWEIIGAWLRSPVAWIPQPTQRHGEVLGGLARRYRLSGNAIPDAHLAAIAIQHGLEICSADTDFARFSEVTWRNPLAS